MSRPSASTATREVGRTRPTAMVNSGLRNGLASAGVMRCMSCQAVISVGPSSLGRMTEIPTGVPPIRLLVSLTPSLLIHHYSVPKLARPADRDSHRRSPHPSP